MHSENSIGRGSMVAKIVATKRSVADRAMVETLPSGFRKDDEEIEYADIG